MLKAAQLRIVGHQLSLCFCSSWIYLTMTVFKDMGNRKKGPDFQIHCVRISFSTLRANFDTLNNLICKRPVSYSETGDG